MPVRINRMKQKLRAGHSVFGGLLRTPEPTLVEVLQAPSAYLVKPITQRCRWQWTSL